MQLIIILRIKKFNFQRRDHLEFEYNYKQHSLNVYFKTLFQEPLEIHQGYIDSLDTKFLKNNREPL